MNKKQLEEEVVRLNAKLAETEAKLRAAAPNEKPKYTKPVVDVSVDVPPGQFSAAHSTAFFKRVQKDLGISNAKALEMLQAKGIIQGPDLRQSQATNIQQFVDALSG